MARQPVVAVVNTNPDLVELLKARIERNRRFVITTPNEDGVRDLVGKDDHVYEVLDDGGDIDAIVQAVREAARARPTR
jgi:hypothetical protein